ncbi:endonuclease III domain-containing protein [Bacteroidota bacterium]
MPQKKTDKIKSVNKLLMKKFGPPPKNKKLPDAVDMLIATILSQNTNDNNSYKAFQNLRAKFKSWDEAASAKRTSIEKEIRVAGLGFQKSKAIKEFLREIKKKKGTISLNHLKELNDSAAIEDLINYNGIGVKTASCVLLFALERNICPVDTHVHRTVNRLGITNTKAPDKTFFNLNENFPTGIAHQFHTNLIRLGREICKPKNPICGACPLSKLCEFEEKNFELKIPDAEKSFMLLDNVN